MINEQKDDFLLIKVDWNGKLEPGGALSPKFTFSGIGLGYPVSVSSKLEHFKTEGWDEEPVMYPVTGGMGWYFQQPMTIPENVAPGTYFIEVDAIFQKEDPYLPGSVQEISYHAPIEFEIRQNKRNEPLVIRATGNAVINTQGMDWNRYEREIVIEADKNAIVNLSRNQLLDPSQPAPSPADRGETDGNTEPWLFKFEPIDIGVNPPPRDTLLLTAEVDEKTYFYHICAKPEIILGRGPKKQNIDFVYRFYRESNDDVDAGCASQLFSRSHLKLRVGKDLAFTSSGKWGTELICHTPGNQSEKYSLLKGVVNSQYAVSDLKTKSLEIILSQSGHLEMKGYCDAGTERLGEILQREAKNTMDVNLFWRKGTDAGVDVLVLKRLKKLTFDFERVRKAAENMKLDFEKTCWHEDPYCDTDRYLFILRAALIGTASGSIAPPGAAGMNLRHAAVYFYEGRFGLVNYDMNPFKYRVQGTVRSLRNGARTRLVPGMTFEIGNVKFHVYESYCSWLKMQRNIRKQKENEKAVAERRETLSQMPSAENVSQATL